MLRRFGLAIIVTALSTTCASFLLRASYASCQLVLSSPLSGSELITSATQLTIYSIGALTAIWYTLTGSAVAVSLSFSALGRPSASLNAQIHRRGAPLFYKLTLFSLASTIAISSPAFAAPVHLDLAHTAPATKPSWTKDVLGNLRMTDDSGVSQTHPAEHADPLATPSPDPLNRRATAAQTILVDLGWGASHPPDTSAAPATEPLLETTATSPHLNTHKVQPGDSLWDIAARDLGSEANDESIAAHWPRWYSANKSLIGPDPNLIHPGMNLHAPTTETS